jgi:hypothetical protein
LPFVAVVAPKISAWRSEEKMNQTLAVTRIDAVEEIGPGIFEVRVLLEDASTATLRMNGSTLCSLADMVSQYATP